MRCFDGYLMVVDAICGVPEPEPEYARELEQRRLGQITGERADGWAWRREAIEALTYDEACDLYFELRGTDTLRGKRPRSL